MEPSVLARRVVWLLLALIPFTTVLAARTLHAQSDCPDCITYSVWVYPKNAARGRVVNGTYVDTLQVNNNGSRTDTYQLTCTVTGGLSCVSVTPSSAMMYGYTQNPVVVTYTVGASGGVLKLRAVSDSTDGVVQDSGWYNVSVNPTVTLV